MKKNYYYYYYYYYKKSENKRKRLKGEGERKGRGFRREMLNPPTGEDLTAFTVHTPYRCLWR